MYLFCTGPDSSGMGAGGVTEMAEAATEASHHHCTGCSSGDCENRHLPLSEEHDSTGSTNSSVSETQSQCSSQLNEEYNYIYSDRDK
jgi:hypothetical protein